MWLFNKTKDLTILFLPVWIIWLVLFLLPDNLLHSDLPLWVWVVFILGIDVSHVWSTIFRTYLDKEEFQQHKTVLILAPIFAFILLLGIALESPFYFWRILAYLAVFHFMKQQYGFFALYTAKSKTFNKHKYFKDKWVLYLSMAYPVLYWHLNSRDFDWFVNGDFFNLHLLSNDALFPFLNYCYWFVILAWLFEELKLIKSKEIPLSYGRILWMGTTTFNWYLGIVWFNSDIAFTITNVVAHGIPYIALIIFYQIAKKNITSTLSRKKTITIVLSILGLSFLFAFTEEFLWDMFINREKEAFFTTIMEYPTESFSNPQLQALFLVLLSLPQVTHYILDGFIWKMNDSNPHLKNILIKKNG